MTTNIHAAARFWIDGLPEPVMGWHTGETWNGFACPAFDFDTAQRIAQTLQPYREEGEEDAFGIKYYPELDAFHEWWQDESTPYEAFNALCDDGQTRRLYGIGAYYWTWWLDTGEPADEA